MQLHESMQTSCISTPCTEWCVGIQGVSVSYSQSLVACLGGLSLLTQICTCYDRYTDKCTHTGYTVCVCLHCSCTCSTIMAHAHALSCIPCASVHTCFLFFFYNPYMCQCKRTVCLSLALFLLASSKLGLHIINHLCRLHFCVVSLTQYQTRPHVDYLNPHTEVHCTCTYYVLW